MTEPKLMGLCGALRKGSTNRLLLAEAARAFGACSYTEGSLHLPLFDADLEEQGMPEAVTILSKQISEADALIIACPEYNKAPPGVLKNALDWISRTGKPLRGKPVAIVSATGGRAGGERTQYALRLMLMPFRPNVLPGPEVLVPDSGNAFDGDGRLIAKTHQTALKELMSDLRHLVEHSENRL